MRSSRPFWRWALACAAPVFLYSTVVVAQSGWHKAGSHPADYDMGNDTSTAFTGTSSGYIKSNKGEPQGFGTYMQTIDAAEYRGKRVRLTAYVKSEGVADWAGVWMRVDAASATPTAFDNMSQRPIKGSQAWTAHSIVLDVGKSATAIAFGVLLTGKGGVWIDDVSFDVVGQDVPVTDMLAQQKSGPRNLDFETPSKP